MANAGPDPMLGNAAEIPPQIQSFAPGKDAIVETLKFFFGNPVQPEKLSNFTEHHAATYHFPDAFLGSSVKLRDTINNLITSSPQEWQTNVALPWLKIEGVTVQWDEMKFDVRLLQRVPYEGASRMQTSIKRSHRDRVVRRGIALIIESDFYRTPQGRQYFADQLTSIRYCVQETANFDVLFAYLMSTNYDHQWDLKKNLLPRRNVLNAMRHQMTMFAAVQKHGFGLDIALEKGRQRMSRYGVTPNMLVMAPETQLYVSMIPTERRTYGDRGERGPAQFDSYDGGKEWSSFRGLGVFTSNPVDGGDNVDTLQMLRRPTQVGEYYIMGGLQTFDSSTALPRNYMDIIIFDESKDRLASIKFSDALDFALPVQLSAALNQGAPAPNQGAPGPRVTARSSSAGSGGGNGDDGNGDGPLTFSLGGDDGSRAMASGTEPRAMASGTRRHDIFAGFGDDNNYDLSTSSYTLVMAMKDRQSFIETALDKKTAYPGSLTDPEEFMKFVYDQLTTKVLTSNHILLIKTLVSAGVWLPIKLAIARPFIEHSMLSAVMAVAGSDTGNTLFGPADMQLSANTTVKVLEGHYTMHSKAVITNHKNCMVLQDIQCDGYIAGCNTLFFGSESENRKTDASALTASALAAAQAKQSAALINDIQTDVQQRLENDPTDGGEHASMFAFVVPYGAPRECMADNTFSLSSQTLPWEVPNPNPNDASQHGNFPGGRDAYTFYADKFNFPSFVAGVNPATTQNNDFIRNGTQNNCVLIQGPYRSYGTGTTHNFYDLTPGQGHFGPDALPGDARWRNGEAVDAKTARAALVGVEALVDSSKMINRIRAA